MALNFQDVIRDVHDKDNHALQISGTIQAAGQATVSLLGTPTVMVGTPTLYAVVNTTASSGLATVNINGSATIFAVVNTSAAGVGNSIVTINPRVDYIGLMSVSGNVNISNPTLYAVVNTSAAGIGNSIVTINPRVDYIGLMSVSGNVAVSSLPAIPAGTNNIGFATVTQVNQPALVASSANIGSVSILGGTLNTVSAVTDITNPIAIKGNVTLSDSKDFIGLTSIQGNVNLNAGINKIGFATVYVGTPTLYAVVNTGAAGIQNSMVTINPRTDYFGLVSVSGNVAVSSLPALTAGAAFVGIVTIANPSSFTGNVTLDAGSLTGIKGNVTLSGPLPTGTLNIGSVSILGGTVGVSSIPALAAGVNSIGFATVTPVMAWPDPKTYIGLVTITGSLAAASGNVTITDGKTFIGSVSVTGNVGLNAGVAGIGFATVNVVNQPALVASDAFIGLVTVANTVAVSGTVAATQSGTWDEVGINDSGNSITVDNAQLSVVGTGTEAAAMRVTIASDSTGVLSVDDNGGAITVDGTVAVTGVSTLAEQQTQTTHLATIAGDTTSIQTAVEILDNAISGSEMQVDVVGALPAGTNAIGKLAANSGVDIGDVDVASVVPGTGATNLGKAEDAAHTTGDVGVMMMGVRNGDLDALTNAEKDYSPIGVSSVGAVFTTMLHTDGTSITDSGGLYVISRGDTAHDSVDLGNPLKVGGKAHSATPTAVAANDRVNAYFDLRGRQQITPAIPEQDLATEATTHVKKYYTNSGAVTDGIVWSPAAGKRWYVTDLIINVSAAATVTLEDDKAGGDEAVMKFELAANSGIAHSFTTPWFSGEDAADLIVTTSAGNVYITVTGYEI